VAFAGDGLTLAEVDPGATLGVAPHACCARLLFVLVWKRETNNRMHILFSKILQILSLLRKGINESLGKFARHSGHILIEQADMFFFS
jgi:hypothetical protein